MPIRVRSFAKINLGLAIGPPRADGYHGLATLYQTLAVHDVLTIEAGYATESSIRLTCSDPRVPADQRNTVFRMVEKLLGHLDVRAEVKVHIQKNLPIQGGMGAGSANAAAALLGLERELAVELAPAVRLELAAQVGSDVPLFLVGGSVLGSDRGQVVEGVGDLTLAGSPEIRCVVALPGVGVSTPLAFREWDRLLTEPDLHNSRKPATIEELSRTYASVFSHEKQDRRSGASGITPDPSLAQYELGTSAKLQSLSGEQRHTGHKAESGLEDDLAENTLLALVRTGSGNELENDFETVVFPQYPLLREIKRHLMGSATEHPAIYAALSGSGSALFGLYRDQAGALAAQQRLQEHGVQVMMTSTLPRALYWSRMFAE